MTRILVVEDEEHLAEGLALQPRGRGLRGAIAPDGLRAVERSRARARRRSRDPRPDAAGLSGFEVLRRARASGDFVPVLILTAKDEIEDRVRGLEEGADDYLVKPFRLDELLARTRGLCAGGAGTASPTARRPRPCDRRVDAALRSLRARDSRGCRESHDARDGPPARARRSRAAKR
jgi:DNA-binding response OmpR family regulator